MAVAKMKLVRKERIILSDHEVADIRLWRQVSKIVEPSAQFATIREPGRLEAAAAAAAVARQIQVIRLTTISTRELCRPPCRP